MKIAVIGSRGINCDIEPFMPKNADISTKSAQDGRAI